MNAKQFLSRARWADKEIESLMKTRDETFARITHITQNYDGDGAQASMDPHKFDSYVALEEQIDQMIDDLCGIKLEIINVLAQLQDSRELMILKSYYVDLKTWEQTAADCGLSWTHTMRLRKSAIKNVDAVLNGITHM